MCTGRLSPCTCSRLYSHAHTHTHNTHWATICFCCEKCLLFYRTGLQVSPGTAFGHFGPTLWRERVKSNTRAAWPDVAVKRMQQDVTVSLISPWGSKQSRKALFSRNYCHLLAHWRDRSHKSAHHQPGFICMSLSIEWQNGVNTASVQFCSRDQGLL